jgi:hypothetical protein
MVLKRTCSVALAFSFRACSAGKERHTSRLPSHKQIVPQAASTTGSPQAAARLLQQRMKRASGSEEESTGKWTMLLLVGIGIFMATLDTSIVNISGIVNLLVGAGTIAEL